MTAWTDEWNFDKALELMPDYAAAKTTSAGIMAIASGVCQPGRQACGLCSLLYLLRDIIDFAAGTNGRGHPAAGGKSSAYELTTSNAKWWKPMFMELRKSVDLTARHNHSMDTFSDVDTAPAHTAYRSVLKLTNHLGLESGIQSGPLVDLGDQHRAVFSTFPFLEDCVRDFIAWFKKGVPAGIPAGKLEQLLFGNDPNQALQPVTRTTSSVYDVGSPSTPRRRRLQAVPLNRVGASKGRYSSYHREVNS